MVAVCQKRTNTYIFLLSLNKRMIMQQFETVDVVIRDKNRYTVRSIFIDGSNVNCVTFHLYLYFAVLKAKTLIKLIGCLINKKIMKICRCA